MLSGGVGGSAGGEMSGGETERYGEAGSSRSRSRAARSMSWLVQLVRCMGIGAEAVPGGVVARVVWPPVGGETVVTPSTMDVERATPCEKPSLTRLQNKTSQKGCTGERNWRMLVLVCGHRARVRRARVREAYRS